METRHTARIVRLSDEIYQKLLVLYPKRYGQKYGLDMRRTFQDCCRFAYQESGTIGLIALWIPTLFDLLATAVKKHRERGLGSEELKLIRFVSALAVVGGLFGSATEWGVIKNILFAPLLLLCGLTGLYLSGERAKRSPQLANTKDRNRVHWAFHALLASTIFASINLLGGLFFGNEDSILELGGVAGYLSMAASHLAAFLIGLWLYRRASLWAIPPALAMGIAWVYWGSKNLSELSAFREGGAGGMSLIMNLGILLFATITVLTSLRAIPALRRAANPGRAS